MLYLSRYSYICLATVIFALFCFALFNLFYAWMNKNYRMFKKRKRSGGSKNKTKKQKVKTANQKTYKRLTF